MRRCWAVPPLAWLARRVAALPQPAFLALGSVLAVLLWPLLGRRRRIARTNLQLCFPDLDARARAALLRANQRATGQGALELLRAWYAPDAALAGLSTVEGLAYLRAALDAGQGVLLLTGHFTHTELAVRLLERALGAPIGVVVRPNNSACLEAEFARARATAFGAVLAKKDVRGLLRELRAGRAVVYSADQDFNYQHAFVPFFGVPAATLTTTPELVRRSGATMLSLFFHRDAGGRYRIQLTPAWPHWLDAEPARAASLYMAALEAFVRRHPSQYLWVHRRFKTRPPGEAAVYGEGAATGSLRDGTP
jgi:KDO2-lipid IV(A) lauroyltransferase